LYLAHLFYEPGGISICNLSFFIPVEPVSPP
jgi:hypothetical protein